MKACKVLMALMAISAAVLPAMAKDVFLLLGQSNMAGRGELGDSERISTERVEKLDKADRWVEAVEPIHFDKPFAGGGLGASFARVVADHHPSATVALVPCAVGGSALDEWMPGAKLYVEAVRRAKIAQKAGEIKAILWHQGESDADEGKLQNSYNARLAKMVAALRAELGLDAAKVPFVYGAIGEFKNAPYFKGNRAFNAVARNAAKDIPNAHWVEAADLQCNGDLIHFDLKSVRILGERYARAYLKAVKPLLASAALERLPLGSIRPEGWLKCYLDKMTDGICGRLYEYGEFLGPKNGWISREERGEYSMQEHFSKHTGWEEQPYWFRSFVKLAALTGNERLLGVCRDWVDKVIATRDSDGWYGPQQLRHIPLKDGTEFSDIWGHMIMNEALVAWYGYSGDRRIPELLSSFVDYCLAIPENRFLRPDNLAWRESAGWTPCIQDGRAGDMVSTLFRLYDLTGEAKYVHLADRVWSRYYRKAKVLFLDRHNVNFCQRFSYPGIYARRNGDLALAAESEYWLQQHWLTWGQMPRCAFAADENVRATCTDPRYGLESCSWGEYLRSFQLLADTDGEPRWADRSEDVVFNHAPCAYTPDGKMVHYITACNQVCIDARTDHDYNNHPPMNAYSATDYRCCLYNAAQPFLVFAENLVKRTQDGALVFWMYAPHAGSAADATWTLETRYPFRETAKLSVVAAKPLVLRFRVPAWAVSFKVGDKSASSGEKFVEVSVPAGRQVLEIAMGAVAKFTPWARQNGVSVDRGPLTYSVAIGERYSKVMKAKGKSGSQEWTEVTDEDARKVRMYTEVMPTTPWNWGVDVSVAPRWRECAWNDDCFVSTNAPCELTVRGRRLPEWTLQDNEPARLQLSPAYSVQPLEDIRFTPLGCQRLRLSVLPQVTDDPAIGRQWAVTPPSTPRASRPGVQTPWPER